MSFQDQHVLVSGGAGGCGMEASRLFAAAGARLTIVDQNKAAAEALAAELLRAGHKVRAIPADVSDPTAVANAVAEATVHHGPVNVLYNHAGTVIVKSFLETGLDDWQRLFRINVESQFLMCQAVLPGMIDNGGGAIVNMSSVSASRAMAGQSAYCTTKAACTMLTKSIAVEFRDHGIRCNAVCPGHVPTEHGLREVAALKEFGVPITDEMIAEIQGRPCDPVEVARTVMFLASDAASFINGETVHVDNAMTAQ